MRTYIIKNKSFPYIIWSIPFLMFMMTLGMNYKKEGTDLVGQVYTLSLLSNDNPLDLLFDISLSQHGLYYATYAYLFSFCQLEPITYIALVAFCFYFVLIFLLNKYIKRYESEFLTMRDYSTLAFIAVTSFSPIYICITRNLFAITILLLSMYLFKLRRFLIGVLLGVLAYISHEGLLLIIMLLFVSVVLNRFILPKFSKIRYRNITVSLICVIMLIAGPFIFSLIGGLAMENNITSEKYNDLYISSGAGDGIYKYVIILSMIGTLYALVVASLKNQSNDITNSICISVLLFVCALFNQKIFLVQRLLMFAPLFIGISLINVYQNKMIHFNVKNTDSLLLLSVPAVLFAQLFFWRQIFFTF